MGRASPRPSPRGSSTGGRRGERGAVRVFGEMPRKKPSAETSAPTAETPPPTARALPPPAAEPPNAEDIRDRLLRAADLRAAELLKLAKAPPGPEDPPFPAYELQSLIRAVSDVVDQRARHLREYAKLTPEELASIGAAGRTLDGEPEGVPGGH